MANTPDNVVATLNSMPQYVEWFEASFPEEAEPVSFDNFAKAIEAYEATLITPAPFALGSMEMTRLWARWKRQALVCSSTRAVHPAIAGSTLGAMAIIPSV